MTVDEQNQNLARRLARVRPVLLPLLLLSLALSVYFERELEFGYTFLLYLVPYFVFLFALYHATSWARRLARYERKSYFFIALLICTPFIGSALANYFIEAPIERLLTVEYCLLGFVLFVSLNERLLRHPFWASLFLALGIGIMDEAIRRLALKQDFVERTFFLAIASSAFGIFYAHLLRISKRKAAGMPRSVT